jgi:hypothetical protein
MALIHVPRPPKSAYNPNRKASALLRNQVEHMHLAERRLPERYRTKIYVNAIRTEGEVAEYIGLVTVAIARAHQDAEKKRAKTRARAETSMKIAAIKRKKANTKEKTRGAASPTAKTPGNKTLKIK